MTPSDWLVLQDTIYSLFPPGDASDFMKWMRNPGAVRTLISVTGAHEDTGDVYNTTCVSCQASVDHQPHNSNCAIVTAWAAIDDARADAEIRDAYAAALRSEKSRRSAAKGVATRAMRRAANEYARVPASAKWPESDDWIYALGHRRKVRFDGP